MKKVLVAVLATLFLASLVYAQFDETASRRRPAGAPSLGQDTKTPPRESNIPIFTIPDTDKPANVSIFQIWTPTIGFGDSTTYRWDIYVINPYSANEPGIVPLLEQVALFDTLYNYVNDWNMTDGLQPQLAETSGDVSGDGIIPSLNIVTPWTGISGPVGPRLGVVFNLGPGEWVRLATSITVVHGDSTCWENNVWANDADCSVCNPSSEIEHGGANFCAAPEVQAGILASTMWIDPPGGTSGAHYVDMHVGIKNIGVDDMYNIEAQMLLSTTFPATSSLISVDPPTSTGHFLTVNPNFNGTGDPAINNPLVADVMGPGDADTLSVRVHFDEGDQTTFSQFAQVFAAREPDDAPMSDTTDCGEAYDNGDGDPGGAGEDDPCSFTVPPTGDPTTLTDVVANAAGNWVGCLVFPQASSVDSVDLLVGANGLRMRDSLGAEITLQASGLAYWPDQTVRVARAAAKFTHAGTWYVFEHDTPLAASDTANTAIDCFFKVRLDKGGGDVDTLTFSRGDFSSVSTTGNVVRFGLAEKQANGGETYLGSPGDMQARVWMAWFADGTQRAWLAVRNQKRPTGWGQSYNAGVWGGDTAAERTCSVEIIREATKQMRLRWASDMNLGSGADTASISLWDPNSYDHPDWYDCDGDNCRATDPCGPGSECGNCNSCWVFHDGEDSDFGGRFLAAMDIRCQLSNGMSPEPVQAWQSAQTYVSTKALPFTDDLVIHHGAAWSGADSLLASVESHARQWIEGVDAENPIQSYWKNIVMFGQQWRSFDAGGGSTAPNSGVFISSSVGHDQYETNLGSLKFKLSTSRVTNDSLNAYPNIGDKAWKLCEQAYWCDSATRINIDYSDERIKDGTIFPHVLHGDDGADSIGRSGQKPTFSYMHGVVILPMYYLAADPFALEDYTRWIGTMSYIVNHAVYGPQVGEGEPRTPAQAINWTSMAYDMGRTTSQRSDLMKACRAFLQGRNWSAEPELPGCSAYWDGKKCWQLAYANSAVYQAALVLERQGQADSAAVVRGYADNLATMLWDHAKVSQSGSGDKNKFRNPPCTSEFVISPVLGFLENWGRSGAGCPTNGENWVNFWMANYASSFAQGPMVSHADETMRIATRHVDDGYNCPFQSYGGTYQKQGIVGHWYWAWAKSKGY